MIACVWFREVWEFSRCFPIKPSRINKTPPIAIPWPPIYLVRVSTIISAPYSIDSLNKDSKSTVYHQRQTGLMRDFSDNRYIHDLNTRITQSFAEHEPVLSVMASSNCCGPRGSTKVVVMPNRGRVTEKIMGASVEDSDETI